MSFEAFDFIDRLLDLDPYTRLGSKGSQEVMAHPFFKGIVWKDLENAVGACVERDAQMFEVPFVPEVENNLDTSYFIDRHKDEKDVTLSMKASLTRSLVPWRGHSEMASLDLNESEDEESDEKDTAFSGFDYNNVFSLKEMNDEQLGCLKKNQDVVVPVSSTLRGEEIADWVGEEQGQSPHCVEMEEEDGAGIDPPWEESDGVLLHHCNVEVEESGDYVKYTVDFQNSSEWGVCFEWFCGEGEGWGIIGEK